TLGFFVASTLSPRLVRRFGATNVLSSGLVLSALGLAVLAQIPTHGAFLDVVLPGGVLATLGFGTAMIPVMIVAVPGGGPHETGLASGLINTSRLVGGALGLAVLSTIAASYASSHTGAGSGELEALTDGYRLAFALSAGIALSGALVATTMLRRNLRSIE